MEPPYYIMTPPHVQLVLAVETFSFINIFHEALRLCKTISRPSSE